MILSGGDDNTGVGDSTVNIFRNTSTPGNISFDTAVVIPLHFYPSTAMITDCDRDGKADLLIEGEYGTINVFRNTSAGGVFSFGQHVYYAGSNFLCQDLNGDSLPDLVSGGALWYQLNTSSPGNLSFAAPVELPKPVGVYGNVTVGDFNMDGKPDIIECGDTNMNLYRNIGVPPAVSFDRTDMVWSPDSIMQPRPISQGSTAYLADVNMDGKPDIVLKWEGKYAEVMENLSTPGGVPKLGPIHHFAMENDPQVYNNYLGDIIPADFDGDGKVDLLSQQFNLVTTRPGGGLTVVVPDSNNIYIRLNNVNNPLVIPSGASPVSGIIPVFTTIDSTVQTMNGSPYIQRHYDIEPANDPATSTATVTLYYTQQDFSNYNALPAHGDDLPTGAADAANKAHILLFQYHGTSPTRQPGSYSGGSQLINPADSNIKWNDAFARWEITFNVTGFSGFFLGTSGVVLPLTLLSFDGARDGAYVHLNWTTANEINVSRFEVQRSLTGEGFNSVGAVAASDHGHIYTYTDTAAEDRSWFYRLKMIDMDGKYSFSRVISLAGNNSPEDARLFPNPAHNFVIVQHAPVAGNNAMAQVLDMSGRVLRTVMLAPGASQTTIALDGLAAGMYKVRWADGQETVTRSLMVR